MLHARRAGDAKLFSMSTGMLHFAFLQILLGALVAGIDAGRGYTDWPLMGGQILPPDPFELTPVWRNFFENLRRCSSFTAWRGICCLHSAS